MSDGGRGEDGAVAGAECVEVPPYRFRARRSGSGPPVILIHGLGGSSDWWRRNVAAIAERHTAVALDLVDGSALPFEFDEIAAVLARWIERSFEEPVHVVGNSMGGQIAIHLAAAHPQLVRSLVLVDSSGIPLRFRPLLHLRNLIVPSGALSIARLLLRDFFRTGPRTLIRRLVRLFKDDVRPLLSAQKMPVLLIWGAYDALVPVAYARQMMWGIPGARLAVIPRAGHVPMWENPEGFNRELLAFFASMD